MSPAVANEIGGVNEKFVAAASRGDSAAMGEVYTEDARILPPGQPMIQGRPAIIEFWAGGMDAMGVTSVELTTVVLDVQDETAEEIGAYTIHGADGVLDEGKYVVVWKKTSDGWRWHWDIWNSNRG